MAGLARAVLGERTRAPWEWLVEDRDRVRDPMARTGLAPRRRVDVTSHFDGQKRLSRGFRLVPYGLPPRCAAACFPEAHALVPVGSFTEKSRTLTCNSIPITIAPSGSDSK